MKLDLNDNAMIVLVVAIVASTIVASRVSYDINYAPHHAEQVENVE